MEDKLFKAKWCHSYNYFSMQKPRGSPLKMNAFHVENMGIGKLSASCCVTSNYVLGNLNSCDGLTYIKKCPESMNSQYCYYVGFIPSHSAFFDVSKLPWN